MATAERRDPYRTFNFQLQIDGVPLGAFAEVSGLKITASGGVASLDDVYAVKELEEYGVDSLIIGKALYEGIFTLEDALDAAEDYYEE